MIVEGGATSRTRVSLRDTVLPTIIFGNLWGENTERFVEQIT
jgi:hypothetical protein